MKDEEKCLYKAQLYRFPGALPCGLLTSSNTQITAFVSVKLRKFPSKERISANETKDGFDFNLKVFFFFSLDKKLFTGNLIICSIQKSSNLKSFTKNL